MGRLIAGRYEILGSIGGAGANEVLEVRDHLAGTVRALKRLKDFQDEAWGARLASEFELLSDLIHPGLVRVHDFGTTDRGRPFLVMDRVFAATTSAVVDACRNPEALGEIARRTASVLAYLESAGVVHGDLKPSNVLVSLSGARPARVVDLRIADFGLARRGEPQSESPVISGTPEFLAPERWLNLPADARSDLFSLGATLWTFATGTAPATQGPYDAVKRDASLAKHDLAFARPDIPESLAGAISSLLARDPRDRPASARDFLAAIEPAAAGARRARAIGPFPFVGREAVVADLVAAAKRCPAEGTGVVVIAGERGVGKTRLLAHVAARLLLDGVRVVRWEGQGANERLAALVAGGEDASRASRARPAGSGAAAESGVHREATMTLVGDAALSRAAERSAADSFDALRAVRFRGAADRLAELGGGNPAALFIDDAHALEPEPAAFLRFLARRGGLPGFLVVAATEEPDAPALADLAQHARAITLAPFTPQETAGYVARALRTARLPHGLVEDLAPNVGGNALLLTLAVEHLQRKGALRADEHGWSYEPGDGIQLSVPDLIGCAGDQLSDATKRILSDASIFSHAFDPEMLAAVRERDPVEIARSLDEASRGYFLVRRDGARGPEHAWARAAPRAAFGERLGEEERRRLHDRALAHLVARGDAGLHVGEEWLAEHALGRGDAPLAREMLRRGAARAAAAADLERAHALLGQALRLGEEDVRAKLQFARLCAEIGHFDEGIACCDAALESQARAMPRATRRREPASADHERNRVDLLRVKAEALAQAGRAKEAVPILEAAAAIVQKRPGRDPLRPEILVDLGRALRKAGEYDSAIARLRSALRLCTDNSPMRPIAWNEIAVCCLMRGDLDRSRDYLERALPLVRGKDFLYEALILAHIAIVERKRGHYARALELREQSDEIRRRLGQTALLANSALERAILLKRLGRVGEALSLVSWAIDENRAFGRAQASGPLVLERGTLLECQGDFAGAEASYVEGERLVESNGDKSNRIAAHFMLGELAVRRREWERAEAAYGRGRETAQSTHDTGNLLLARRNDGFLLAERGEASAAIAALSGILEELRVNPRYEWAPEAMIRLASAHISAGHFQAARETLAGAERILKSHSNSLVEGLHARVTAELLARDGQPELALAPARRSLLLLREGADVFESACTLVLIADLEIRQGRQRQARSALLEAREIFGGCGLRDREGEIDARIASLVSGDAEGGENFAAICRVMETVAAIREPDRLLVTMLDLAIDHVNAERGFVVLYGGGGREDLEVRAAREISSESAAELARVSRRILAMAGQETKGIISERAVEDARFRDSESVIAHNVLSVICAPLRVTGRTLGFVYVDNRRRTRRFTSADAEFVEAFAVQTAFALERAHEIASLETALRETRSEEILIGKSPAMQRVLQLIDSAAHVDHLPVHITGENGTGKELAATLIQKRGQRRDRPFIRVNCAAFSETLIESELFGHEKGAFTGAGFARAGIFERADGGTLFLDEIGEIPESVQLKLLRVLQEFTLTRVGGQKEIRVDVRIISATNADLERRIQAHAFRTDLYYRLQGLQIQLPPLRERLSDVPELVEHFLRGYERTYRKGSISITPDAIEVLRAYSWPGNVRQLDRELHQALALALPRGNLIRREDFSSTVLAGNAVLPRQPDRKSIREHVERAERDVLSDALARTNWNRSRAAKLLNCSEALVRKKIRKYGLSRPQAG